jgi:4-carboxymuconolactone decarboxylase
MSRIADLNPATLSEAQKRVYDAIVAGPRGQVRGPLAVWLHRPELASRAQALGQYCRYETSLPARLSELAILVMGRHWNAEFEWWAHKPIALKAGLDAGVVEAIRTGTEPAFDNADEAVVYEFVRALHDRKQVPDALYRRAVEALGEGGVVDLVGIIGYYTLISVTIQAFEVAPPDGEPLELGGNR